MKMRKFTNSDAIAFPGYDPHNSKVSEEKVTVFLTGIRFTGKIVQSKFEIEIILNTVRNIPKGHLLHKFMTVHLECMAMIFAEDMCKTMPANPSIEFLFLNGFSLV